jgi:cobalt-zinc-cadmium resistance protein CzcA
MMLSKGIGAEMQRPLATEVDFGMACDTFLAMLALPVLYLVFGKDPQAGVAVEDGSQSGLAVAAPEFQAARPTHCGSQGR